MFFLSFDEIFENVFVKGWTIVRVDLFTSVGYIQRSLKQDIILKIIHFAFKRLSDIMNH